MSIEEKTPPVFDLLKQLIAHSNLEVLETFGPCEISFEIAEHVAALRLLVNEIS